MCVPTAQLNQDNPLPSPIKKSAYFKSIILSHKSNPLSVLSITPSGTWFHVLESAWPYCLYWSIHTTLYPSPFKYSITSSGNVEDGLQTGVATTYLADVKKFTQSHWSSSYNVGYGGAGYVTGSDGTTGELYHRNPEKEAYHPFIHKQVLNYKIN